MSHPHSPGPWAAKAMYDNTIGIYAGPGAEQDDWSGRYGPGLHYVCVVPANAYQDGNVRILLTTPKLLDALKSLTEWVTESFRPDERPEDLLAFCESVIAEAKGG